MKKFVNLSNISYVIFIINVAVEIFSIGKTVYKLKDSRFKVVDRLEQTFCDLQWAEFLIKGCHLFPPLQSTEWHEKVW